MATFDILWSHLFRHVRPLRLSVINKEPRSVQMREVLVQTDLLELALQILLAVSGHKKFGDIVLVKVPNK